MKPTILPTLKQHLAWEALRDPKISYLLFGGGAGGGKSWLGAEWIMTNCYMFAGTRWFIGREELKRLKETALLTFFKVCSYHKIPQNDYAFNGQGNFIQFTNGSRVDLLDLKYLPSDPLFERFGSSEYTGGWIEEAGEVEFGAFDILKTRIGRWKNDEFGLNPAKLYITANPKKNWLYQLFYKPWKEKALPEDMCFIQALVDDNDRIESSYRQNLLKITDRATKERLLFGNWEYDDDPSTLIDFDAITDLFTNSVPDSTEKYLVADIARFGADRVVISLWRGLRCYKTIVEAKRGIDETARQIKDIANKENIPFSHILVDEDGVGGGVVDILRGIKGFMGASSPLEQSSGTVPNYQNLKSQCTYKLVEMINDHAMAIDLTDTALKQSLVEELEQIKSRDSDKDGKLKIIPKEEVKELLGRSPDLADCLMMRMFFELTTTRKARVTQFMPTYSYSRPIK